MNIRILAAIAFVWVFPLALAAFLGGTRWMLLVLLSTEAFAMLMAGLMESVRRGSPPPPPHVPPAASFPPPWRPPSDFHTED